MYKIFDVLFFLRQIFFPCWKEPDDETPSFLRRCVQRITTWFALFFATKDGVGTLFSIVLHLFIIAILSFVMLPKVGDVVGIDILGGFDLPRQPVEAVAVLQPQKTDSQQNEGKRTTETKTNPQPHNNPVVKPAETIPSSANSNAAGDVPVSAHPDSGGLVSGGGFGNRNAAGRGAAVGNGDCSAAGENALEAALEWLAAHQQPDGGWSLYFKDSCSQCTHSGTGKLNRRTAATALALLPFLGAGYTHQEGKYRAVVERGLKFLIEDPNAGIDGVILQGDAMRMYSHGLASIALCEAYALSQPQRPDSMLGQAAQRALWTIETAQDSDGGGWRYRPNQSGDTSVFAWQLMALKSGKIGGLHVSQSVLYGAYDFLDAVALEGGRRYNYLPGGGWDAVRGEDSPKTCSAIGLVMRMYLGWKPGDPELDDGIETLAGWMKNERSLRENLYFSYYALLALHHYGGNNWKTQNEQTQRFLVRTQSRSGHEAGSWFFNDPYCDSGGRLLNTALGAMILETPYRIMPLYRK